MVGTPEVEKNLIDQKLKNWEKNIRAWYKLTAGFLTSPDASRVDFLLKASGSFSSIFGLSAFRISCCMLFAFFFMFVVDRRYLTTDTWGNPLLLSLEDLANVLTASSLLRKSMMLDQFRLRSMHYWIPKQRLSCCLFYCQVLTVMGNELVMILIIDFDCLLIHTLHSSSCRRTQTI